MLEGIFNALGVRSLQIAIQIVGFLLVFFLLRKFLWKPILGLMDQREKEVSDLYSEAGAAKAEGEKLVSDYRERISKAESEAQQKMVESIAVGNEQAGKIVEKAREEAEKEKQRALNTIQEEVKKARMELRDFSAQLSVDIAAKILREDVDKSKHEDMIKQFLSELETRN